MEISRWQERDARRLHLLEKLFDTGGLTEAETQELRWLQMERGGRDAKVREAKRIRDEKIDELIT